MKIIKQNDSAGGLIFKQNTGGKAMKQNYNFGKGFWKSATNNVYIECPAGTVTSLNNPLSIVGFIDASDTTAVNSDALFRLEDQSNSAFKISAYFYRGTYLVGGVGNAIYNVVTLGSKKNLIGILSDGVSIQLTANLVKNSATLISTITPATSYRLLYGRGGDGAFAGFVYNRGDDFFVFDRLLSDTELSYLWNFRLGNDPLSVNMLKIWYKFNIFEILPFGGVDAVCVRDESGNNNHGKLIGLPAGTLQEQLDWANLNCLK